MEQGFFLDLRDIVIAGTEMAVAQLLAIERHAPQIPALVLEGMEEATHPAFPFVEESQVFAAIDHLVAFAPILPLANRPRKCLQAVRRLVCFSEQGRSAPQALYEGWTGTVCIIVQAAARPAGKAASGLAKMGKVVERHEADYRWIDVAGQEQRW